MIVMLVETESAKSTKEFEMLEFAKMRWRVSLWWMQFALNDLGFFAAAQVLSGRHTQCHVLDT
jgi:hypothetical protein